MVGRHALTSGGRAWFAGAVGVLVITGVAVATVVTRTTTVVTTTTSPTIPTTSPTSLATTTTTIATVTIDAVGDTELGNTPTLPLDPASYLAPLRRYLDAPIVFGNLEGTMTAATRSKCRSPSPYCYAFRVPTSFAQDYRAAGFTVLNSANNHAYDYGAAGIASTSRALARAGIVEAGLPGQIGLVHEGALRVAFVDFAPYYNTNDMLDLAQAATLIADAHREAQVVVVYMHAGAEGPNAAHVTRHVETFAGENRGNPYQFAHAAIDDGADLVLASGPHVLRGLQWYRGHLIDYSLGDFVNYYDFATVGPLKYSAVLRVTLGATGSFVSGRFTSFVLTSAGLPQFDPSGAAASFVNRLSTRDFGASAAIIGPAGVISPVG